MSKGTEAGKNRAGPGNSELLYGHSARWVESVVGDKPGKIGCQSGSLEGHTQKFRLNLLEYQFSLNLYMNLLRYLLKSQIPWPILQIY